MNDLSKEDAATIKMIAEDLLNIAFRVRKDFEAVQVHMGTLAGILGVQEGESLPEQSTFPAVAITDPQTLLDSAIGKSLDTLSRDQLIAQAHAVGCTEQETRGKSVKVLREMLQAKYDAGELPAKEATNGNVRPLVKVAPKMKPTNGIAATAKVAFKLPVRKLGT